jgi:hypothetical protein
VTYVEEIGCSWLFDTLEMEPPLFLGDRIEDFNDDSESDHDHNNEDRQCRFQRFRNLAGQGGMSDARVLNPTKPKPKQTHPFRWDRTITTTSGMLAVLF